LGQAGTEIFLKLGLDWWITDGPSDLPDGLITTSVVHHHPLCAAKRSFA
jgi:hypothetical protein